MLQTAWQQQLPTVEAINSSIITTNAPADTAIENEYISSFTVVYTQFPHGNVQEIHGNGTGDINQGFGGKYVHICLNRTSNPALAITGFTFHREPAANIPLPTSSEQDLAKGAGGDYRYLRAVKQRTGEGEVQGKGAAAARKVKDVWLWRTKDENDLPPSAMGFDRTTDINEGRGGDYLYLCWTYH
ncbi:hypothetical protein BDR26DRAFT_874636, partial [Obelidium mucronatum]